MDANRQVKAYELKAIIPIIRKRKWLIIIPWIIVSGVVFGGSYLMTPMYSASTIVSIEQEVKLSDELQRMIGINRAYSRESMSSKLRGIYNEITSTRYVSELNDDLKLGDDPAVVERANKITARNTNMTRDQVVLNLIQAQLKNQVQVGYAADDQVQISAESANPARARDIANALAEIFIDERHRQEVASVRSSQDFSDVQLQKYEKLVKDKIQEKTQMEKDFMKIQLDESITSESNRSEITSEVDRTNNDITDQRNEERNILGQLVKVSDLSTNNLNLNESDQIKRAKSDLKELLRSTGSLMIRYTWSDPQILNHKVKQNNLLNTIEAENARLVKQQYRNYDDDTKDLLTRLFNTRSNLDYLYQKQAYLKSALDELTDKMNMVPEYQAQLNQLNQEIATATELRDKFKKQQESSTISQALLQDMSSSKYRVVEPAKIPVAPFKPDRIQIVLLGVVLGLVIGAAAAMVAELMDSSFKKVEDVKDFIGLPVIGVVPKIEFLKRVGR